MSDRDVRKLAEEIRQVVEQDWTGHNEHDARLIADRITAFQAEREAEREAALQVQFARALGEGGRPPRTLCLNCGPNVSVDEDGCCAMCGAEATGCWLERIRVLDQPAPEGAKE